MIQDARTHQWADLLELSQRWTDDYPDLTKAARTEAFRLLKSFGLSGLDPDEVYWHRFSQAWSSRSAYSGWAHPADPVESCTLPELVLRRFSPADQESLDILDQMSGFYTTRQAVLFDESCEVRLRPSELCEAFWKNEFASRYHKQLADFWRLRTDDFIVLGRAMALARLGQAREAGLLGAEDFQVLRSALAPGIRHSFAPQALARRRPPAVGIQVALLRIGQVSSQDLLRIVTPSGGIYLYSLHNQPLVERFSAETTLYDWLRDQARSRETWAAMRKHLDLSDSAASALAQDLIQGRLGPAAVSGEPLPTGTDPFEWLAGRAKEQMQREAQEALTSNSRLRKAEAIGFLSTLSRLSADLAPLGWPLALTCVAAATTTVGLYVDQAMEARSAAERNEAIIGAVGQGLLALFTLPFLVAGEMADWPWETDDDRVTPTTPSPPRSPVSVEPLNARGMIERTDVDVLFAVQEAGRDQPAAGFLESGLPPTTHFHRLPPMSEGPALRTFATAEGALAFAKANFDGPFHMFRIQARGLRVASLRLNLRINRANTLALLGEEDHELSTPQLERLADGAWLDNECHLAADQMSAARLRLLSALEPRPWRLPGVGRLRGVRRQPLSNVLVPSHLIEVEDSLRLVRFDPFSESWRTPSGSAFRYSDRTGRFEPFDHAQACAALAPQIEAATAEFGIPASYPWVVPELDQAQRLPLPRDIHSIWLGRRMPRPLVENVLRNAREAGKGRLPFTYHLYVDVADPLDHSLMMADLAQAPVNLRVHELRRTPFFEAFAQSPYHLQFKAATEGTGINYASAVDVLRYRLLHFHGGVYMDVDDFIYASPLENEGFSSQDWTVAPERLLLNNLVSEPRLGLVCGFNTSNFATLPANPLLEAVSKESYSRFLTNRDLYFQRPYEGIDSPEQVTAYARRINQVTGPGVFNDVLLERLPDVRQFRALCRIANELYVPAREFGPLHREIRRHAQRYCPLGWRIRIGATSSWLHTR